MFKLITVASFCSVYGCTIKTKTRTEFLAHFNEQHGPYVEAFPDDFWPNNNIIQDRYRRYRNK